MRKDMYDLPPHIREQLLELAKQPEPETGTDDIPEITDWTGAQRGLFRPVKKQVTIRLDAAVIQWFKSQSPGGRGYQSRINYALRDYIRQQFSAAQPD